MVTYIIFGGCILLAVCWMLFSLPARQMGESDIPPLLFDIIMTIVVVALFATGTVAYAGQQAAREAAVSETRQEEMTDPVDYATPGSAAYGETQASEAES